MKNLNLNEQEKQRGWHDFCSINHANQTEVQADTLSASGRSAVSVTLEECPANNALITRLSRANNALLPLSRCVNTLIRIGDYVVGGHARRGAGKEVVAMMRQKCMMWKYAAMVVLMLTLGVGEMWATMANFIEGSYIYIDVTNCTDWANSCTLKMNWFDSNGNSKGNYIGAENYSTNIYRFRIPSDGIGGFQLIRLNPNNHGQQYNYSGTMYAKNRSYDSQNCLCVPSGAVADNANFTWSVYHPYTYIYDGSDERVSQVVNSGASNGEHMYVYSWKNWDNVDEKEYGDWRGREITKTNGVYAYYVTEGRNYKMNCYTAPNNNNSQQNESATLYATSSPSQAHHHNDGTYYWTGGDQASNFYGTGIRIKIVSNAYELYVGETTTFTIEAEAPLTGLEGLEIWEDGVKIEGTPSGSGTSRTFNYTATSAGIKDISARIHFTFNGQAIYLCAADMRIRVYEKYTIKVQNTFNWDKIKLHMFRDADNEIKNSAWPGVEVTEYIANDGEHDWYFVTLDSKFDRFMLANSDGSQQTYSGGMSFDKATYADNCYIIQQNEGVTKCYTTEVSCPEFYRLKSVCAEGTYYSNTLMVAGTMSLYAETSKSLTLQHLVGDVWTDMAGTITATGITKNGVYTAEFNGTNIVDNFALYTGDYHIHCGATTANYLTNGASNERTTGTKFIYFENNPIFGTELFNYYWLDWFPEGQTVVATVGNEYNDNLANVIGVDAYAPDGVTVRTDPSDSKEWGGNVRFGYNPNTNYFSRAIIAGSGAKIKIQGTYVTPSGGSEGAEASFGDASAWVYTLEASVKGQATATVTTSYNEHAQTLEANKQLIGGETSKSYNVLITYDFKTNRLLAAWQPPTEGESFDGFDLSSNLMAIRTENAAPTVLNLTTTHNLSNIQKIYTALELTYDNWTKSGGNADRRIVSSGYIDEYYWISLPYDCNIGDIFGIEGYGDSWVIQTYHGDYRARDGWWAETESWWYDLDRTDMMEKNKGYVLRVTNLDGENGSPDRFPGSTGSSIFLYFPSKDSKLAIGQLSNSATDTTTTVPEHKCEVWRGRETNTNAGNPNYDRRAIDSNWNIIGSPSFNSAKITTSGWSETAYGSSGIAATPLKFFYTWAANRNPMYKIQTTDEVTSFEFQATHAYLVQYAGDITWVKYDNNNPLVVLKKAPARDNEEQGDRTLKMVLNKDGEQADVAYISRMAEGATEGYDLNLDLSKLLSNSGNNLYTLAGYYKMAGNCLPETTTTVPVGVQIAAEGEYTFSMPEGTNGTGAVLIDNIAGTRTNLALTDYTVQLPAGQTDNRFVLELSPISNVATGDLTPTLSQGEGEKAHKALIDGVLYIVKDGQVFDARGNKVK